MSDKLFLICLMFRNQLVKKFTTPFDKLALSPCVLWKDFIRVKMKHKLPKQMKILGLTISSTIWAFLNHSAFQSICLLLPKVIINFGGKGKSVSSPEIVCLFTPQVRNLLPQTSCVPVLQ